MKNFSVKSLLAFGLLASALSFTACQKENEKLADTATVPNSLHYRSSEMYGVTIFGTKPSVLVEIDALTGGVNSSKQVFFLNGLGQHIAIPDLKGITLVGTKLYAMTGANNPAGFVNSLVLLDPATGEATLVSTSNVGPISDIEYDGNNTIYGLRSNTNALVAIVDNANNWGTYTPIGLFNGLAANYVAKGLAYVNNQIVVAATSNSTADRAKMYTVPVTAGAATYLADVNPLSELNAGHCALGFNFNTTSMAISRNFSVTVSGLNSFAWATPLPNPSGSTLWGGIGAFYEDLTTSN